MGGTLTEDVGHFSVRERSTVGHIPGAVDGGGDTASHVRDCRHQSGRAPAGSGRCGRGCRLPRGLRLPVSLRVIVTVCAGKDSSFHFTPLV